MAIKTKQNISIDKSLMDWIKAETINTKGGVSGWINAACKKHMRSGIRSANRRSKILAARKTGGAK